MTIQSSSTRAQIPTSGQLFDLPRDAQALEQQHPTQINLNLQAQLSVQGEGAATIALPTQFFFKNMLANLEAFTNKQHLLSSGKPTETQAFNKAFAYSFHKHLMDVLNKQDSPRMGNRSSISNSNDSPFMAASTALTNAITGGGNSNFAAASNADPISLTRQNSIGLLSRDLSTAEALLDHGVEPYIAAVRKLLHSNAAQEEFMVEVALKDYCYTVLLPESGSGSNTNDDDDNDANDGSNGKRVIVNTPTFGSMCTTLFCGVCQFTSRMMKKNMCKRRNSSSVTTPLLNNNNTTTNNNNNRVEVLKDITATLKPGRLTLILGPPGSGKTSLLKAISGQLLSAPGKHEFTGDLTYNGRPVHSLKNLPNWVSYVSQHDEHIDILTVKETMQHAFNCRKDIRFKDPALMKHLQSRFGEQFVEKLQLFGSLDVDIALAVLGLTECQDTIVGNVSLKGISGGQKRRTTLGEMLVTGAHVFALDEISTGLDSASTYDIVSYLSKTAHILDQTIVVALLQPPPEVIDLFDDVMVIADGQLIYHGERSKMLNYFEGLGFKCPPRKDLGDFLQELPTRSGIEYRLDPMLLREAGLRSPPTTAKEFAERWRASDQFKIEDAEVRLHLSRGSATINNNNNNGAAVDIDKLPQNSWARKLQLALFWTFRNRIRDKVKVRAKLIQNIFMGLLFGSLFYKVPKEEAYQKTMLLFNVLMFSAQTAIPEVQANIVKRAIYHKHIDAGFYPAWMIAFAQTITSLPFTIFDVLVFGNLVYWMCGLNNSAESFGLYVLISTLYGQAMQTIMGILPYIIEHEMKCTISAVLILIVCILLSGVVATEGVIPIYLKPIFHANPLSYAFRALANVEYLSKEYDDNPCPVTLGNKHVKVPQRCGDFFLGSREVRAGWNYVWEGIFLLVGYQVVFWCITALALTYIRFDRLRGKKRKGFDDVNEEEIQEQERTQRARMERQESTVVQPVTLVVSNLSYTLPPPKRGRPPLELLSGISMWALPGRMLALMGSSGAGKTTLLDVLAGIKTQGKIRGDIFLNGRRMTRAEFTKVAGYVQQFGVHSDTSTIRESLEFSFLLRLPKDSNLSPERRSMFVQDVMKLLELDEIQNQLAGACSMEQNKRLTLGVELVANPSILFCDEPTSGLDARAAAIVMRVLQRVAKSGRLVICTIHQPSIAIFQRFDDLLLLKKGGKVAYFGEIGQDFKSLISYFEAIPGTKKCEPGVNPAAWMLEVIGGGTGVRRSSNTTRKGAAGSGGGAESTTQGRTAFVARGISRGMSASILDISTDQPRSSNNLDMVVESHRSSSDDEGGDGEEDGDSQGGGDGGGGGGEGDEGGLNGNADGNNNGRGVLDKESELPFDFAQIYAQSDLRKKNDARMKNEFGVNPSALSNATPARLGVGGGNNNKDGDSSHVGEKISKFSAPIHIIFRELLKRNFIELWRSPEFSFVRVVVVSLFCSMFVCIFFQQEIHNVPDTQSRILCISFSISLTSMFAMMSGIPYSINKRPLFYREKNSGMYSSIMYTLTTAISEVPYVVLMSLLAVNIIYWGVGFNNARYPYIYFTVCSTVYILMMAYVGLLMSSLLPEALSAQLASSAFFSIFNTFAGINVPFSRIPKYYHFLHYMSPMRYLFEGILTTQFHGNKDIICNPTGVPLDHGIFKSLGVCTADGSPDLNKLSGVQVTLEEFVLDDFLEGFEYSRRYIDIGVLFAWIVVVRIITTLATVYISFEKR
jgi:ABC-type multidrug transport system ATPase subunit